MADKEERRDKDGCPYTYTRGASSKSDQQVFNSDGKPIGHYESGEFFDEHGEHVDD